MKGFNVKQGGAVGMLMYNTTFPSDVFTDNHWLPAAQLEKPDADALLAFLAAHPSTTATMTQGTKTTWQGDVMTSFSSRGPGGDFLKPDVTAPGLHILAGTDADSGVPVRRTAREPVPGDRRYFDVVTARRRSSRTALRPAPVVDAGPGQVRAGDNGQDDGQEA